MKTTTQRTVLEGNIVILSDSRLPKYEAKIWPLRPGKVDSRYEVILNADGVAMTKNSGKDYVFKNAEKIGFAWLDEMVSKHANNH